MKKILLIIPLFFAFLAVASAQSLNERANERYEYALVTVKTVIGRQDLLIIYPDGSVENTGKINRGLLNTEVEDKQKILLVMNRLGSMGFELVSVRSDTTDFIESDYIFRKKITDADRWKEN